MLLQCQPVCADNRPKVRPRSCHGTDGRRPEAQVVFMPSFTPVAHLSQSEGGVHFTYSNSCAEAGACQGAPLSHPAVSAHSGSVLCERPLVPVL